MKRKIHPKKKIYDNLILKIKTMVVNISAKFQVKNNFINLFSFL